MVSQRDYWNSLFDKPLDASVIDPKDLRGEKNLYLSRIRNELIVQALRQPAEAGVVLDLGCGTGGLTHALAEKSHSVIGVDISQGLLKRTKDRRYDASVAFVCYDGTTLPIKDESVAAVTTYVVLTHVMNDIDLLKLLRECHRVLKLGGQMICIEQCRWRERVDPSEWKHFRTRLQWGSAFRAAGFEVRSAETVRFGHFPATPLIRAGLVPRILYRTISRIEKLFGRMVAVFPGDYCDVLFVLIKSTK